MNWKLPEALTPSPWRTGVLLGSRARSCCGQPEPGRVRPRLGGSAAWGASWPLPSVLRSETSSASPGTESEKRSADHGQGASPGPGSPHGHADGEGRAVRAPRRKSSTEPAWQEPAAAARGPCAFAPPRPAAASLREPEPRQGSPCSGHPLLSPTRRPGRRRLPARPWLSPIAAAAAAASAP